MENSDRRTAGFQNWRKLAFIHWRIPADSLQALVPNGLTIEQFDGSAWLGIVPFSMERIRPWWSPPVPGISWFLETNVRTYVVDQRGVSGVWFFSLDANKQLAVSVARTFWHLPYKMATMSLHAETDPSHMNRLKVIYKGLRTDAPHAQYEISLNVSLSDFAAAAQPSTLEHFLVERYILFAQDGRGRLMSGRVHHAPYQIRPVDSFEISETLSKAAGSPIPPERPPDHAVYSDGVDVRVSPLTRIE